MLFLGNFKWLIFDTSLPVKKLPMKNDGKTVYFNSKLGCRRESKFKIKSDSRPDSDSEPGKNCSNYCNGIFTAKYDGGILMFSKKPGRPVKPLPLEKYGRLRPVAYVGNSKWECICDCGRKHTVSRTNLISGKTKSCGCLEFFPDLGNIQIGPRYNFFNTVAYNKSKTRILCVCVCNREFVIPAEKLYETLSCGCIRPGTKSRDNRPLGINKTDHPLYRVWLSMVSQEELPVDSKWKSDFLWFLGWVNTQPLSQDFDSSRLYLVRKDKSTGFFPKNCELSRFKK